MQLIHRWLENTVTSGLEMPTRDNLQGIADVDNQRPGLIRHIMPLFVAAPDLQTRDGNREQQGGQTEVSVAVHAQAFRCLFSFFLDGSEECVAEVTFTGRAPVGLDVVPEIVVGQFQDTRKERQESSVDGFREVVRERLDLVHERVQTLGHSVDVFPVLFVPVELFNAIEGPTVSLEIERKIRMSFRSKPGDDFLTLNP